MAVRSVWVIYPAQSMVYVYSSSTEVRVLKAGDELDGGDVLPALRILVQKIFRTTGRMRSKALT